MIYNTLHSTEEYHEAIKWDLLAKNKGIMEWKRQIICVRNKRRASDSIDIQVAICCLKKFIIVC